MFKKIPGYENYSISRSGILINNRTGKRLKPIKQFGYLHYSVVGSASGGKRKAARAHRLVYFAWAGPIPKHLCVNHKNSVRHDNRISNLELLTLAGNVDHAIAKKRMKVHAVIAHCMETGRIYKFRAMNAAIVALGLNKGNAHRALRDNNHVKTYRLYNQESQ